MLCLLLIDCQLLLQNVHVIQKHTYNSITKKYTFFGLSLKIMELLVIKYFWTFKVCTGVRMWQKLSKYNQSNAGLAGE